MIRSVRPRSDSVCILGLALLLRNENGPVIWPDRDYSGYPLWGKPSSHGRASTSRGRCYRGEVWVRDARLVVMIPSSQVRYGRRQERELGKPGNRENQGNRRSHISALPSGSTQAGAHPKVTAFPLVPWEISHTGLFPLPLLPLEPSTLHSSCQGRGDERAQRQRGGEAGGRRGGCRELPRKSAVCRKLTARVGRVSKVNRESRQSV